jgi:hypothetical protein
MRGAVRKVEPTGVRTAKALLRAGLRPATAEWIVAEEFDLDAGEAHVVIDVARGTIDLRRHR